MSLFGPSPNLQAFHRLAEHCGQPLSGNATEFTVTRAGQPIDVVYAQAKNNITLTLRGKFGRLPDAVMRTENRTDGFGKKLGLNNEPQTGDELFDKHVFVACSRGDANMRRLLEAEGLRKGILFLLQSGFTLVDFGKDGLSTSMHFSGTFSVQPAALDSALTALEMIAADLPDFSSANLHYPFARPATLLGIGHGLLIATGLILLIVGSTAYTPLDWAPYLTGLGLGAVLWFFAAFTTARWLRGKIDAFRAWLLASGLSFFGFPLLAMGGLLVANAALDSSPPTSHSVVVLNKTSSTSRKSRKYYLHVQSWRPTEPQLKIRVPSNVYSIASIGNKTTIITHQGYLGWEWILKP